MPRPNGTSSAAGGAPVIDVQRKFVRVVEIRPDGFVAFDFAVGEPEIYVEMLLPQEAFVAFCREQDVIDLTSTASDRSPGAGEEEFAWNLRDAAEAAGSGRTPTNPSDRMGTH